MKNLENYILACVRVIRYYPITKIILLIQKKMDIDAFKIKNGFSY